MLYKENSNEIIFMFAIIIPYYQQKPGLLTRAIESIINQTHKDWEIIIIDDESPLPVEQELKNINTQYRKKIHTKRIQNKGPGGARNIGLDIAQSMNYIDKIAFLDSDDYWKPLFLERAHQALQHGDLYFSDYIWPEAETSRFPSIQFDQLGTPASFSDGKIKKLNEDCAALILEKWPICICALAFNKEKIGEIRFDLRLKLSGEDIHYFLKIIETKPDIFFDLNIGLNLGPADGFFSHGQRGSIKHANKCIGNYLLHCISGSEINLSPQAQKINTKNRKANLKEFFISEAKGLIKDKKINIKHYPRLTKTIFSSLYYLWKPKNKTYALFNLKRFKTPSTPSTRKETEI